MKFDPSVHHRRSIRLHGYDYSQPGAYFVTICVQGKEHLLGDIVEGEMGLNAYGTLVAHVWSQLTRHYPHIPLDEFCVMPNHVHGIVEILPPSEQPPAGAIHESPLRIGRAAAPIHELPLRPRSMLLPRIIGRFKMTTAKLINEIRGTPGKALWQRNYYEHIIRNPHEFDILRQYIATNPLRWSDDPENFAA